MTDDFGFALPNDLLSQVTQKMLQDDEDERRRGEYARVLEWVRTRMPVLVQLVVQQDDEAIRGLIRGSTIRTIARDEIRRVVVQGSDEADRVIHAWFMSRYHRGVPQGGATHRRLGPW